MTANELAVDLELQSSQMEYGYAVSDWKLLSDSATMLRQQQVEIEALKQHWSEPQTDLIVLLREEVTLMQKYLQEQNLREHFVAWRQEK